MSQNLCYPEIIQNIALKVNDKTITKKQCWAVKLMSNQTVIGWIQAKLKIVAVEFKLSGVTNKFESIKQMLNEIQRIHNKSCGKTCAQLLIDFREFERELKSLLANEYKNSLKTSWQEIDAKAEHQIHSPQSAIELLIKHVTHLNQISSISRLEKMKVAEIKLSPTYSRMRQLLKVALQKNALRMLGTSFETLERDTSQNVLLFTAGATYSTMQIIARKSGTDGSELPPINFPKMWNISENSLLALSNFLLGITDLDELFQLAQRANKQSNEVHVTTDDTMLSSEESEFGPLPKNLPFITLGKFGIDDPDPEKCFDRADVSRQILAHALITTWVSDVFSFARSALHQMGTANMVFAGKLFRYELSRELFDQVAYMMQTSHEHTYYVNLHEAHLELLSILNC